MVARTVPKTLNFAVGLQWAATPNYSLSVAKLNGMAAMIGLSALLISACDDDAGGDLRAAEGKLALDPPRINFGLVQVNTESTAKVVMKNIGDGVLTIGEIQEKMGDDVVISFDCGPDSCSNRLIPSSGSAVLNVNFAPTQFGEHKSAFLMQRH